MVVEARETAQDHGAPASVDWGWTTAPSVRHSTNTFPSPPPPPPPPLFMPAPTIQHHPKHLLQHLRLLYHHHIRRRAHRHDASVGLGSFRPISTSIRLCTDHGTLGQPPSFGAQPPSLHSDQPPHHTEPHSGTTHCNSTTGVISRTQLVILLAQVCSSRRIDLDQVATAYCWVGQEACHDTAGQGTCSVHAGTTRQLQRFHKKTETKDDKSAPSGTQDRDM